MGGASAHRGRPAGESSRPNLHYRSSALDTRTVIAAPAPAPIRARTSRISPRTCVAQLPTQDTLDPTLESLDSRLSSPTDGLTYSSQFAFDRWPRKHWRPCGTV